jgi:hypothetical protein
MTVVSSKVFELSASGGSLDVEALRTQLRKITDGQLREFSNASKYMNHAANHRSRTASRLCAALDEARAEGECMRHEARPQAKSVSSCTRTGSLSRTGLNLRSE